jgi:hypothetical protein
MLVPGRMTAKMTVKTCAAQPSSFRINSLEASLTIEWE